MKVRIVSILLALVFAFSSAGVAYASQLWIIIHHEAQGNHDKTWTKCMPDDAWIHEGHSIHVGDWRSVETWETKEACEAILEPTATPTPTDAPTFTPTATNTPTDVPTFTPTSTEPVGPTLTPTNTPPGHPTFTPTPTPTGIAKPKKPVCKSIPECGGRMEEWAKAQNNLVHVFYAKGDCAKKIGNRFCYDPSQIVSWIYMRSERPYFLLPSADVNLIAAEMAANNAETNPEFKMSYTMVAVDGVQYVAPVSQVSPDGKGGTVTYYILDMPSAYMGGNWVIYTLDANNHAVLYREMYGPQSVDKYISCSRSAGLWDVDSNGNVTKFKYGGYNSWDWFWYLYKTAGWSFNDAMKWSLDFWVNGHGVLPVQ